MFRCFRRGTSPQKAIKQMRQVEQVLSDMIYKYENLRRETGNKFKQTTKKSKKLILLKKIKSLDHYIRACENKIAVCVHKQYALEQLEVTKMQVDAIRASTGVFHRFSKYNPIQKIEDLQDTMEEQLEALSDITGLLEQSPLQFDDEELIAEIEGMQNYAGDEQIVGESTYDELPKPPSVPLCNRQTRGRNGLRFEFQPVPQRKRSFGHFGRRVYYSGTSLSRGSYSVSRAMARASWCLNSRISSLR